MKKSYLKISTLKIGFCFVTFFGFSSFAFGSNTNSSDIKFASIGLDVVTQCWPAVSDAAKELEIYQELIRQHLVKEEAKLQKKGEDLQKQRNILTNEMFQKEIQNYKNQFDSFNQKREKYVILLEKSKAGVMEHFQTSITSFAQETAQSLNIDVVLPSSVMLYNSGKIKDISEDVCGVIKRKARSKINVRPIYDEIIKNLDLKQLYFPTEKDVKSYKESAK